MANLQVPYSIEEDAKTRVEWIDKRVGLTSQQKEYIEFQIKEATTKVLRGAKPVNEKSDCSLGVVSKCKWWNKFFIGFSFGMTTVLLCIGAFVFIFC